jgi:hypothetical protein
LLLLIGVYQRSSAAKLSSFREAGAQPNFHGASKLRRDLRGSETLSARAIIARQKKPKHAPNHSSYKSYNPVRSAVAAWGPPYKVLH